MKARTSTALETIADIDFAALYRKHMAAVGRPKPAEVWDARADAMNQRGGHDPYTAQFIEHIDFEGCHTLLDVGCGTGAIALAAAPRLDKVYGLDYSPRMLTLFAANAERLGLREVQPILCSWEDDWQNVPECDLVVASRSTAVMDMADALSKLNQKAKKRVYLTSLVGGQFADAYLLNVIGRSAPPGLPDYIYILNILHAMAIHPRLDYIETGASYQRPENFEEFVRLSAPRLGPLNSSEHARLKTWFHDLSPGALEASSRARWALISWETSSLVGLNPRQDSSGAPRPQPRT